MPKRKGKARRIAGWFARGIAFGLAVGGVSSSAFAERGTPVLEDNAVRCLNKVLTFDTAHGTFSLQVDGEKLLSSYVCYAVDIPGEPKTRWCVPGAPHGLEYVKEKTGCRREGNAFVFESPMRLGDVEWMQYRVEFELLSNGLVRVTHLGRACPDPKVAKVAFGTYFISCDKVQSRGMRVVAPQGSFTQGVDADPKLSLPYRGTDRGDFTLCAGDPAREVRFYADRRDGVAGRSITVRKDGDVNVMLVSEDGVAKTFYIDIRDGVKPVRTPNVRGGIDFMKVERLEMPDISDGNLAANGSFETDLRGWALKLGVTGSVVNPERYATPYFARDMSERFHGRYSLKCFAPHEPHGLRMDNRQLRSGVNIFSMPNVAEVGTYTVSFWAKGSRPEVGVWFWNPSVRYTKDHAYNTAFLPKTKKACFGTELTTEWKRYSYTFDLPLADPLGVAFNVRCRTGEGWAWIDAIQVERGAQATEYRPPLAEAQLVTSSDLDFIEAGRPLDARLEIAAAPHAKGEVRVEVKGFRGERVAADTLPFAADGKGLATVALPWKGEAFGCGLFLVKYVFTVGGKSRFQHDRFAVVRTINKSKRWSGRFANLYGNEAEHVLAPGLFRRYEQVGLDGAYHVHTGRDNRWVYRETGHDAGCGQMVRGLPGVKWGVIEVDTSKTGAGHFKEGDTNVTVWIKSHKDEGVPLDDAYLARFKAAVKARVAKNPHVRLWEFANEFTAFCKAGWWNDAHDDKLRAADYAKYLKAYVEGGKEANPSAVFMNDAPCNMSPGNGIPETENVIDACTALGFRLDAIAHHTYRFAPENPDLEADWQELMNHLRKNGYPETTPFHFGEGMHWGPYEIPAWELYSSTWYGIPGTWSGNLTLSYDMGLTERRSAAWRARSFLVGLRHAPRLLQMNSGNVNNFDLDLEMTPRASQLVTATLLDIFGNADFVADIRFAPYVRTYLFKDELNRPCAAVWCHKEDVDFGREKAPEAEASFGKSLLEVRDLMNRGVAFSVKDGRLAFPVTSAPRFYIGRPGTLEAFRAAFTGARVTNGRLADRYAVKANPIAPDTLGIALTDRMSGSVSNVAVRIEPALTADTVRRIGCEKDGVALSAFLAKRAPDDATLATLDWSAYPALGTTRTIGTPGKGFRAQYRVAWNAKGLFLEVDVRDATFVHVAEPVAANRWNNDALQIYFDLLANARSRDTKGYDQDDAEFMVLPAADASSARVWRVRGCDQQLGLGVQAPKDKAWADDVRVDFAKTASGYRYRLFFPDDALLPAKLRKGTSLALALCVNDANSVKGRTDSRKFVNRRDGYVTTAVDGTGECWKAPHVYPVMLLWDE